MDPKWRAAANNFPEVAGRQIAGRSKPLTGMQPIRLMQAQTSKSFTDGVVAAVSALAFRVRSRRFLAVVAFVVVAVVVVVAASVASLLQTFVSSPVWMLLRGFAGLAMPDAFQTIFPEVSNNSSR